MNDEATAESGEPTAEEAAGAPGEEELRRQIDEQVRKLRVQDLLLESAVSLLNLTARRIAKEDERDLEQARVGIEAVRGMVQLLDPEPAKQVREALSHVQMLFAKEAGGGRGTEEPAAARQAERGTEGEGPPAGPSAPKRPPGLWTPPGA